MDKNFLFHIYWGVGVILLPIYFKITPLRIVDGAANLPPVRHARDFLFCGMVLFSLVAFGFNSSLWKKSQSLAVSLLGLIFLAFFSRSNFASANFMYQFFCFCMGAALLAQMVCNIDREFYHVLYLSISISCLIQVASMVLSLAQIDLWQDSINSLFSRKNKFGVNFDPATTGNGSLRNSNTAGAFVAISIPFLPMSPFVLIPAFISLFASKSSMAVISLVAGTISIIWAKVFKRQHTKKIIALGLSIVSYVFIRSLNKGSYFFSNARYEAWKNSTEFFVWPEMIKGRGLGFFSDFYQNTFPSSVNMMNVHNEYISFFLAFGVIGVSLACWFFWKEKDRILSSETIPLYSFFILAYNSFGNFSFHVSATALLGIISLAMILNKEPALSRGI